MRGEERSLEEEDVKSMGKRKRNISRKYDMIVLLLGKSLKDSPVIR